MNKIKSFKKLLPLPTTISELFHDKTKIKKQVPPEVHKYPEEWIKTYYKGYSRLDFVTLPKPNLSSKLAYKKVISNRRSIRNKNNSKIGLKQLNSLLYFSAGKINDDRRFYPSAGARYPLEVYLISLNTDLEKGLYHYYVRNHGLEKLATFNTFKSSKYFIQDWLKNSSCLIIISAVFKRTINKYNDRGYRHILMEAGHLGQNFYLNSSALNLSCCSVVGFYDNRLNHLLDIDGLDESVLYTLAIGKK